MPEPDGPISARNSPAGTARIALGTAPCCEFGSGLSGQKFYDENCDGQQEPWESGVPGWTIQLSNGQTAQTDANGYYSFPDLPIGSSAAQKAGPAFGRADPLFSFLPRENPPWDINHPKYHLFVIPTRSAPAVSL